MKWPGRFVLFWGVLGVIILLISFNWRHHLPTAGILFLYLFSLGIASAMRARRFSAVIYNLSFVLAALAVFEIYLWYVAPPGTHYEGTYDTARFFTANADLGYAILPEERIYRSIRKADSGTLIYDVQYPIDQYGQRKSVPAAAGAQTPTDLQNRRPVFFFGCSFTFGEAVSEDPFPQAFSKMSGIRSLNFGVPGYGPHQFLRSLEQGLPRAVEPNDPLAIVFTLLPEDHVWRAGGLEPWDKHGPLYEIVDGKATYVGPFSAQNAKEPHRPEPLAERVWKAALFQSRIYNYLTYSKPAARGTMADRERVLAILQASKEQSERKYHARFMVVLWDVGPQRGPRAEWFAQKLPELGIPTLRISSKLPDLGSAKYVVDARFDAHPNGEAHALVARAIRPFIEENISSPSANH
jgi:hypothetical protein